MALSIEQKEQIIALFKQGNLSNVSIAKEVGCGETAVRRIVKEFGAEKSEIKDLAEREVTNTIIANEIKAKKSEFTEAEKRAYNEEYLTLSESLNLFNNSTIENQLLINTAQSVIKKRVKEDELMAVDQLPNIIACTKGTEANRKQMLGITEPYKPKGTNDGDEVVVEIL